MPLPRCVYSENICIFSTNRCLGPKKEGLATGVGSKAKVPLGSSGWGHAGWSEWTSLNLKAQKGGEEGVPAATGRGGGEARPQPVPFRGDSCIKLQFSGRLN